MIEFSTRAQWAAVLVIVSIASAGFPAVGATHAVTVETTSPGLLLPIGSATTVGYRLLSPDGCPFGPSNTARLDLWASAGLGVFPSALIFTTCDTWQYATVEANALGTLSMTVTAVDGQGTFIDGSPATVTVTAHVPGDPHPPTVTTAPDQVVEALSPAGASAEVWAVASDPEQGSISTASCAPSGPWFPINATGPGKTYVTCLANDASGNIAVGGFWITVVDTTPPLMPPLADQVVEADPDGAIWYDLPPALDLVSGEVALECTPGSGTVVPVGVTRVACTATDRHGNSAGGGFFALAVADPHPPAIEARDVAQVTGDPAGAIVAFEPLVFDGSDPDVKSWCDPESGSFFPVGDTLVTCYALDASGNLAVDEMTVTVLLVDDAPPVLALPLPPTLEATGPDGATFEYDATAWDLVDGDIVPTCDPTSGSVFPLGETTVTCTAVDVAGNEVTGTFVVTVQDTTPPDLALPADTTLWGAQEFAYDVTSLDLVDADVTIECDPASGALLDVGSWTIRCIATDDHGNRAEASFVVTVRPNGPPTIAPMPDLTFYLTSPGGTDEWWESPPAFDFRGDSLVVDCDPAPGTYLEPGTYPARCWARDDLDQLAETTFTIRVLMPPPVIGPLPDQTREATGPGGAVATWPLPAAFDGFGDPLAVTCAPPSGSTFPLGQTAVTCTATDAYGDVVTSSFTVTVQDTTPPTLPALPDIERMTTGEGANASWSNASDDIVDLSPDVACSQPWGWFPVGTTIVTCTSTDDSGNVATASFTVVVRRALPPAITVPGTLVVEATGPGGAAVTYAASALDPQDGALAPVCAPPSGGTFPLGETVVTCSVTNSLGLTATATFVARVQDTTPPVLTLPSSLAATATGGSATVTWSASALDVVSGATATVCTPASGSAFAVGATTVSCASTDGAGNTATRSFVVTVEAEETCDVEGWMPPIDTPGHTKTGINSFKAGSTIPVKILVGCEDGAGPDKTPRLHYAKVRADGSHGAMTAAKSRSETANLFKGAGNHWQYGWDARGLGKGTFLLFVDLGEGGYHTKLIELR